MLAGSVPRGAAESVDVPAVRYEMESTVPEFPRHHVGVFLGGSSRFSEGGETEAGLTLGLEYEYRFGPKWGTGLLSEGVVTSHGRDAILLVPLNWHPWEWLKLTAAPGVEFVAEDPNEFVMRFGAAYEIELGKFSLAPEIAVDLTRESQTLVYGLSVGRRF